MSASHNLLAIGSVPFGTVFPVSPAEGDRFYRADLHREYFRNGSNWLSSELIILPIAEQDALNPVSVTTPRRCANPFWNERDLFIERVVLATYSTIATTDHYFTAQLTSQNGATPTPIGDPMVTQGDPISQFVAHVITPAAVVSNTVEAFELLLTETGAANCYAMASMQCRIVG